MELPNTAASCTPGRLLRAEHRRAHGLAFQLQEVAAQLAPLQLARARHGDQPAAVDERDAVAVLGFVHVVGRDQHRDAVGRERVR